MNRAATEGVASSERAVEIEAALPAAGAGERAEAEKPRPPAVERTLVIVKPDGVQRGLVGAILGRLEGRGLKLRGLKFMSVSRKLAEQHYAVHRGKPFYEGLVKYISSGPVVAAVFEGKDAVGVVRATVGATDPAAASPGTIRGDWAVEIGRNLMHASDSRETGEAEIALWFPPKDLVRWRRVTERWISEMGG